MKRAVVIALAALVSIVLLLIGHREYVARRVPEPVFSHVRNATLRASNNLALISEPANITYAELFAKIEKDVVEIDSKVIDVQSLVTPKNAAAITPFLEYMKGLQAVLRAERSLYMKEVAENTSTDRFERAQSELAAARGSYGYEYAQRVMQRASEDVTKSGREATEAQLTFEESLRQLMKTASKIPKKNVPPGVVLNSDVITGAIKRSMDES